MPPPAVPDAVELDAAGAAGATGVSVPKRSTVSAHDAVLDEVTDLFVVMRRFLDGGGAVAAVADATTALFVVMRHFLDGGGAVAAVADATSALFVVMRRFLGFLDGGGIIGWLSADAALADAAASVVPAIP